MEYKIWLKQSHQENITYLAIWGILFITPLLSMYVRTVSNGNAIFDWTEIFFVWRRFSVFLLLFLIHNFLLTPLLFCKHKRSLYFTLVAIMVVAFAVYQHNNRPGIPSAPPHSLTKREAIAHRPTQANRQGGSLNADIRVEPRIPSYIRHRGPYWPKHAEEQI